MWRYLLILVLVSSLLAGCIPSIGPGVRKVPFDPSMIKLTLAPLDPEHPFGDGLEFLVTSKPNYDAFFLKVATIQGTLALADTLISQFGQALVEASKDAFIVPRSKPQEWAPLLQKLAGENGDLTRLINRGTYLKELVAPLGTLPLDAASLIPQVADLAASAPNDFKGWGGKADLLTVMSGISSAGEQLKDAGARAKSTLSDVIAVVNGLAQAMSGNLSTRENGS